MCNYWREKYILYSLICFVFFYLIEFHISTIFLKLYTHTDIWIKWCTDTTCNSYNLFFKISCKSKECKCNCHLDSTETQLNSSLIPSFTEKLHNLINKRARSLNSITKSVNTIYLHIPPHWVSLIVIIAGLSYSCKFIEISPLSIPCNRIFTRTLYLINTGKVP